MQPRTKKRLFLISLFVASITAGLTLILYNLSTNIAFFVTPTELLANPTKDMVKLGGYVKAKSLEEISLTHLKFKVTDRTNEILVEYQGPVPAIFRETQGVVVIGIFNEQSKVFIGSQLLAKHDERYMPKNVADKIKN